MQHSPRRSALSGSLPPSPVLWRAACTVTLSLAVQAAAAQDEFWPYRVERGDTLIGIRDSLLIPGADWRELQRVNRITDPRRLVPGSTLKVPLALLREQALVAEVLHAQGEVDLLRPGAAAQRLVGGESLAAGDQVRSGPQSSAALRFADGSRVLLRPHSALRIQSTVRLGTSSAVETKLRLDSGSVDSQVPPQKRPRFEIRTPVANLGVRGTEFRTHTSGTQTAVEVLDGRVATSVGQGALRNATPTQAGFGTLATARGIEAPRPLPAAPQLQSLSQPIGRLPLRLSWGASAGAAAYRAQVFDADQPDRLLLDGLFTDTVARWSEDLADGRYRFRVRAVDGNGLEGFDASVPFTLKARPEPPFTTRPRAAERTADERIRFAWTKSAHAARYRLQVADSADFATPRVDRAEITGDELHVALPVGTHHWRVASVRADGDIGPWSDPLSVTRVELPPPPTSQPPRTTDSGVLLAWRESVGARYQVQVASDAGFTTLLHDETVDTAQWMLPAPEPGRYFVRIRSVDADGFAGPFGTVQQVDVAPSAWWWLVVPAVLLLLL